MTDRYIIGNMRKLTIIITASPIPTHPSLKHIDGVIDSLDLLKLPEDTLVVLAHDYPSKDEDLSRYLEYYENLKKKYKERKEFVFTMTDEWSCLTGSIRSAFKYVDSKYVLLVQHDFPFITEIDFNSIIEDMDNNPELKHIRFNKRVNRQQGMDWICRNFQIFNTRNIVGNYSYMSTLNWSDNNHISPSDYYRNFVFPNTRNRSYMEHQLLHKQRILAENSDENNPDDVSKVLSEHDRFGTYIFGQYDDPPTILHTDGREAY